MTRTEWHISQTRCRLLLPADWGATIRVRACAHCSGMFLPSILRTYLCHVMCAFILPFSYFFSRIRCRETVRKVDPAHLKTGISHCFARRLDCSPVHRSSITDPPFPRPPDAFRACLPRCATREPGAGGSAGQTSHDCFVVARLVEPCSPSRSFLKLAVLVV